MTVTERTRVDGKLLEETNIAVPDFGTEWEYISRGPYRVQRRYSTDDEGCAYVWDIDMLSAAYAVGTFVGVAFPMQREATVVLMDETFRCILGYTTMWGGLAGVGMGWWGTAETFRMLALDDEIDELELAVWESIARRYVS